MTSGLRTLPLLMGILYIGLAAGQNYDTDTDTDKVNNAIRIIEHIAQTRKGLGALRNVIEGINDDLRQTQKIKDLTWKRKGLDVMKRIVEQMDTDLITEQKRTCALNLGGHCATESAASLADQWHYLNSHLSPGRKRRDTRLFQKLIKGEIFD